MDSAPKFEVDPEFPDRKLQIGLVGIQMLVNHQPLMP